MENITRQEHPQLPPMPPAQPPGTVVAPGGSISQVPVQTPTPSTEIVTPTPVEPAVMQPAPVATSPAPTTPTVIQPQPVAAPPPATTPVTPAPAQPAVVAPAPTPPAPTIPSQVIQPQVAPPAEAPPEIATQTAAIPVAPAPPPSVIQPTEVAVTPVPTPAAPTAPVAAEPANGIIQPVFNAKKRRFKLKSPITITAAAIVIVLLAAGGVYALKGRQQHQKAVGSATSTSVVTAPNSSATAPTSQSSNTTPSSTSQTTTPKTTTPAPSNSVPAYEAAIQKFITAIQNNDKATADSLQAPAFTQALQRLAGTTSFYDACQSTGSFCAGIFDPQSLATAKKVSQVYVAADGTRGQEDIYTFATNSAAGTNSDGTPITATIAVVPSGGNWLIYHIDQNGSIAIN